MTDQPQRELPAVTGTADHGHTLTLRDAADRLQVSVKTVRRMVDKGELVGAALTDGPNGKQWLVSVAAVEQVLAARAQKQAAGPLQVRASAPVSALQDELVGLRRQVSELQARTAVAEALAADRQREVERLHESLRVLALTTGDQQPRGHWWNRRKK